MVGDGENSQILSKSKGKKDKLETTGQVLPSHSTHSLCIHLTLAGLATACRVSSRPLPSEPVFLGTPLLAVTATLCTCRPFYQQSPPLARPSTASAG